MKKAFLTSLLFSLTALSCSSCFLFGGDSYDLTITYYNGGYGADWIDNLVKRFEEAKGVKVKVTASQEGNCGAENYIKSGKCDDIYIGEGMPWKSLVQEGYLADLTDVYEAEVQTSKGTQKVKDFMDQTIVGNFYSQRRLSDPTYVPWAMPWSAKPNAMAYNVDVLTKIPHVSQLPVSSTVVANGKWVEAPVTVADLKAFCEDVNAYNDTKPASDTHKYVPLGWCGSINADSVGFLITTWWAEAQGLEVSNYPGEGSYYDFFNYGNTTASNVGQTFNLDVFKQTGLMNAYDLLETFLFDENHNYINSINDAYNITLQNLQMLFVANNVNEKPVLSIASSYLENEVIKNQYIDSDKDGQADCTFKFTNVPKLDESSEDLLYLNFSDSMIIPATATHLDLAKEFFIFMSSEQEVCNFAQDTNGGIRPFNCDVRTTGYQYSTFASSLFDVYYNSKPFYEYPANTTSLAQVSHIYRYKDPSYHGSVAWLQIIDYLRNHGTVKTASEYITDEVINGIKQNNYDVWTRQLKMTDATPKK